MTVTQNYIIEECQQDDLPQIAELWNKMISFYYILEKNFVVTEDSKERYLNYLNSIIDDNLTKILVAKSNLEIRGFIIAKISIRPPVIVKGHMGYIEDYWVNRLTLNCDAQQQVKKDIYLSVDKWFKEKNVQRIRLEISTRMEDEQFFWQKLGFELYKSVMYK